MWKHKLRVRRALWSLRNRIRALEAAESIVCTQHKLRFISRFKQQNNPVKSSYKVCYLKTL